MRLIYVERRFGQVIKLFQITPNRFRIEFGQHIRPSLSRAEAQAELGWCILEASQINNGDFGV